jgi:acylphosphatase
VSSPEDRRRLEAVVIGRVHGVGFRLFALGAARALGLRGWVANEPAGRVRVVAEGPEPQLRLLLEQLRAGPPAASVEHVAEDWAAPSGGFHGFEIRSGFHGGD